MTNGKVNIDGKEYETVASRVQRFREKYKETHAILTEIVQIDEEVAIVKATIYAYSDEGDKRLPIATGYAEEKRNASYINRTSALENAETSAIGRCLANFGMAGTEYASADEVANAIAQQKSMSVQRDEPKQSSRVSAGEAALLLKELSKKTGLTDKEQLNDEFVAIFGQSVVEVDRKELDEIIRVIRFDETIAKAAV